MTITSEGSGPSKKHAKNWKTLFWWAHLETKQSNVIKQQAEAIEEQRKLNQETDKRIADLVSVIGKLTSKMPSVQP